MRTNKVKPGKIISRPSLYDTMRHMRVGEARKFSTKQFKLSGVRVTASVMKKSGYEFTVSEQGLVDEFIITRLK